MDPCPVKFGIVPPMMANVVFESATVSRRLWDGGQLRPVATTRSRACMVLFKKVFLALSTISSVDGDYFLGVLLSIFCFVIATLELPL